MPSNPCCKARGRSPISAAPSRKIAAGETLTREEAADAFELMMSGAATPAQIGAFLALRVRGETVDEIAGAARAMRAQGGHGASARRRHRHVGTGGDAAGTLQHLDLRGLRRRPARACRSPSTATASLSSRSGAADVLAALGVKIECAPETIARCIDEGGLGFMFAPAHHPAMSMWRQVRAELGTRTIFNLLGPLANPAGVKYQLVGVFGKQWVEPIAHVLGAARRGARLGRAWRATASTS